MFGSSQNRGANAYAQVGLETGVFAASPQKLILMLFDGAIVAINNANRALDNADIAAKGIAISKAISIIDQGLRASLDKNAGGEIAANLDSLYEYLTHRLVVANLENNKDYLTEVLNIMRDLKDSWEKITPTPSIQGDAPPVNHDPLAPKSAKYLEA